MRHQKIRKNIGKEVSSEELLRFTQALVELEPLEFLGVLKMLCVEVREPTGGSNAGAPETNSTPGLAAQIGKSKARPFEILLSEAMDVYIKLGRKQRQELAVLLYDVRAEKQKIKTEKTSE